ncbi:TPR domain protein [Cystobacter fuscus DSM 2262]|uniref:TPR domain protein n=1 Tax=Cystobacter fuscus (strain ATCC 25194 / DSM 2262 / NBRC 100088 / M29) TaxID=1242864 RepID=S9QF40_CYSF2|nr:hypothetical protein [Cystobacter fuscus]EPX59949.1 TPR domain protein [Cystobacter fuscus DSM 2262]
MRHSFWKSFLVGFPCLALVVLPPAVGHAEDDDKIWDAVYEISQLYEKLEYEQAFTLIQGARRLPRGVDGEVTLSLYEGIILCEMGLLGPSRAAFREALLMRPGAELPEDVAPKVALFFEAIRLEVTGQKAVVPAPSEEEEEEEDDEETEEQDGPVQVHPEQQTAPVSEKRPVQAVPEKQSPSTVVPAELPVTASSVTASP